MSSSGFYTMIELVNATPAALNTMAL